MITARAAAEQGREVFALPGSIHSPLSKGGHALIKQGAKLVESADDVLSELNAFRRTAFASTRTPAPEAGDASTLLSHMGFDPVDLDSLSVRAGLPVEYVDLQWDDIGWESRTLANLSPLGQVPTLQLPDGTVMTESAAILIWLGLRHPASGLLPADYEQAIRGLTFIAANCSASRTPCTVALRLPTTASAGRPSSSSRPAA